MWRRWLTKWQKGDLKALEAFNAVYDRRAAGKRLFGGNRFVHDFEALVAQLTTRLSDSETPPSYPGPEKSAARDALALALKLAAAKEECTSLREDPDLLAQLDVLIEPAGKRGSCPASANAFHILRFLAECELDGDE